VKLKHDAFFKTDSVNPRVLGNAIPPMWIRLCPNEYWDGTRWCVGTEADNAVVSEPQLRRESVSGFSLDGWRVDIYQR
jgi:hypothetical protein